MKISPSACDSSLLQTVISTVEQHGMFAPGDAVLAGVSGGPDSVALIHILVRLADRFSLTMGIAHLNHCLRGEESDRDALFVADLAETLNLPFFMEQKDVEGYRRRWKLSPEEAARRVRYAFFEETAAAHRFDKIALGHHADDNAELVLMNLLRGSGPSGVSGIPPVRGGRFVRPMLHLYRRQLIDFLAENDIPYITDSSNTNMRCTRNRIRHQLIPMLQSRYNPKIAEALNRLADILRADEAWLDPMVEGMFSRCLLKTEPGCVVLSVPELRKLEPAPRRRVVRRALSRVKGDLRRISLAHIDRLALDMLGSAMENPAAAHLPDRIRASRTGSTLCIVREKTPLRQGIPAPPAPVYQYRVDGPSELEIPEIDRRLRLTVVPAADAGNWAQAPPDTAFFDMARLRFPLIVRNAREGDRFTPLGLRGTQKLKSFFINNKVPVSQRRRCPVLLQDDVIIWVAGFRIADAAKVAPSSKNLLKAELLLA